MNTMRRYGKGGWFGESHRHYLASKGISSKSPAFREWAHQVALDKQQDASTEKALKAEDWKAKLVKLKPFQFAERKYEEFDAASMAREREALESKRKQLVEDTAKAYMIQDDTLRLAKLRDIQLKQNQLAQDKADLEEQQQILKDRLVYSEAAELESRRSDALKEAERVSKEAERKEAIASEQDEVYRKQMASEWDNYVESKVRSVGRGR